MPHIYHIISNKIAIVLEAKGNKESSAQGSALQSSPLSKLIVAWLLFWHYSLLRLLEPAALVKRSA